MPVINWLLYFGYKPNKAPLVGEALLGTEVMGAFLVYRFSGWKHRRWRSRLLRLLYPNQMLH
jgi:hypothetical protein